MKFQWLLRNVSKWYWLFLAPISALFYTHYRVKWSKKGKGGQISLKNKYLSWQGMFWMLQTYDNKILLIFWWLDHDHDAWLELQIWSTFMLMYSDILNFIFGSVSILKCKNFWLVFSMNSTILNKKIFTFQNAIFFHFAATCTNKVFLYGSSLV